MSAMPPFDSSVSSQGTLFTVGDGLSLGARCPACQHGDLVSMVLMDTVSCSFCRHIFSVDPSTSMIQLEDSVQRYQWRWAEARWHTVMSQTAASHRPWLWSFALLLMLLPSALVFFSVQLFPASPQSQGAAIAFIWPILTIFAHACLALGLILEHYQWAFYLRLKLILYRSLASL